MTFRLTEIGIPGTTEEYPISKFHSNICKVGVAKPTLYRIEIGFPIILQATQAVLDLVKGNGFMSTFLNLYLNAENAEFPGVQLNTGEVVYGNQERKFAYGRQLNELTVTFRIDADMSQKKLFDTWFGIITNPKSKQMGFKDDYVSDIKIYQLNDKGELTYSYFLLNAFPTSVGSLSLGYDQQSQYHKLSVTFSYDDITTSTFVEGIFNNVINSGISSLIDGGVESLTNITSNVLGSGSSVIFDVVKSGGIPIIKT